MVKLKVYGGLIHMGKRGQLRTIVSATGQQNAAQLVGCSVSEIRNCWEVTENEKEKAAALAQPGVVLQASDSMGFDFASMTRAD